MKKTVMIILILIAITIILFPKRMGYDGGLTGGTNFYSHCIGYVYTTEHVGPVVYDGIDSAAYCIGVPYN